MFKVSELIAVIVYDVAIAIDVPHYIKEIKKFRDEEDNLKNMSIVVKLLHYICRIRMFFAPCQSVSRVIRVYLSFYFFLDDLKSEVLINFNTFTITFPVNVLIILIIFEVGASLFAYTMSLQACQWGA